MSSSRAKRCRNRQRYWAGALSEAEQQLAALERSRQGQASLEADRQRVRIATAQYWLRYYREQG